MIDPTLRPAWVVSRIEGSRISPATTELAPGWIKQFWGCCGAAYHRPPPLSTGAGKLVILM